MKFNNNSLHNLKKNNLLFISSLIIIILFSLYINSHFKETFIGGDDNDGDNDNDNDGSDETTKQETAKSLYAKINEEKKKLLTDEEKGSSTEITMEDFLSGDDGNRRKGIYKTILEYYDQLNKIYWKQYISNAGEPMEKKGTPEKLNKLIVDRFAMSYYAYLNNKSLEIYGLKSSVSDSASGMKDSVSGKASSLTSGISF